MARSLRLDLERAEAERLAPWALRSASATRRRPIEDEGRAFDYRSAYQRDRDRIVYSRAFRRLRQKAQAGILPAYEDHRRNRLTHTLEVAQLARTLGRALGLNEDLVEAIALGHDLGQPAFGGTGERALDDLLRGRLDGRGGAGLGDLGGFRRAAQSLRVVDHVEKRYGHPGLNLTDAVREGVAKSDGVWHAEGAEAVRNGAAPLFEAQTVGLADRMASALHDLDDALQSGAVSLAEVERLGSVRELRRKLGRHWTTAPGRFLRANAIHRGLVHLLVTGAVLASGRALAAWARRHGVRSHADFERVREAEVRGAEIALPPSGRRTLDELEAFLGRRVRRGFEADRVDARGRRVLLGLFAAYQADPVLLEDHVLLRYKEASGRPYLRDVARDRATRELGAMRRDPRFVQVVVDHLAAMTDAFALAEHARLHDMGAVPIPGAERLRDERGDGRLPDAGHMD